MARHGIVSADSHMMEPADLWQQRLDWRLRERAPRVIENTRKDGPRWSSSAPSSSPTSRSTS